MPIIDVLPHVPKGIPDVYRCAPIGTSTKVRVIPDAHLENSAIKGDLATRMARDKGFIQGTEQGLTEIEQSRYSRIEDIKKKLGDL